MSDITREGRPAFRVFVFGVELTDDVEAIGGSLHDNRSPSVQTITLASPQRKYVLAPEDIQYFFDDTPLVSQSGQEEDPAILLRQPMDPLKERIVRRKIDINEKTKSSVTDAITLSTSSIVDISSLQKDLPGALTGYAQRYYMQAGSCIFHTNDPVTIFERDPFDLDQWHFRFRGVISDTQVAENDVSCTVTLTVASNLRALHLSRFTTNYALFDYKALTTDRDLVTRTWLTDNFDVSLVEFLWSLLFGPEGNFLRQVQQDVAGQNVKKKFTVTRYSLTDQTEVEVPILGAGAFNSRDSRVYLYGGDNSESVPSYLQDNQVVTAKENSLETWQDEVTSRIPKDPTKWSSFLQSLHCQGIDEFSLVSPAKVFSNSVTKLITYIGTNPHLFPPDYGRLLMLIPSKLYGKQGTEIMLKDFVTGIATRTEFTSRLQAILNITDRIDFSLYTNQRGDIVCEMPLYQMDPSIFGKYKKDYRFYREDIEHSASAFTDTHIKTQYRGTYNLAQNRPSIATSDTIWATPAVVTLNTLIPAFGARMEQKGDPLGFIDSLQEATLFALLKLAQNNADAWKETISTIYRPGLGPNRPCWFEHHDFIATIREVSSSTSWGTQGSLQQSLSLNYRRGWAGQRDANRKKIYEFFAGMGTNPLNFADWLKPTLRPVPNTSKVATPKAKAQNFVVPVNDNQRLVHEAVQQILRDVTPVRITSTTRNAEKEEELVARNKQAGLPVIGDPAASPHVKGNAIDYKIDKEILTAAEADEIAQRLNASWSLFPKLPSGITAKAEYPSDRSNSQHSHVHVQWTGP